MSEWSRRRFIACIAALGAGRAAHAQPAGRPVLAYLGFEPLAASKARVDAFRQALRKLHGDFRFEPRSAEGRAERLQPLAEALVKQRPAAILSESALTTLALRNATDTLPIVMAACDDPLASRFVRALDKPGGNVTGVATGARDELPVPVELLSLILPKGASFAGIFNPANAMYRKQRAGLHYGAVKRGLAIGYHDATDTNAIDAAFAAARAEGAAALVVVSDPLFMAERARFVKLAAAWGRPVIFPERNFVVAGGLISYGPSLAAAFARAASHADRILRGASPAEIAVETAGKHELVVRARAPAVLRKRADAVL